jgi:hypothetical protein
MTATGRQRVYGAGRRPARLARTNVTRTVVVDVVVVVASAGVVNAGEGDGEEQEEQFPEG